MYCYTGGTDDTGTRSITGNGWGTSNTWNVDTTGTGRRLLTRTIVYVMTSSVRDYWQPVAQLVPKNWRWFHVFFGWAEPIVPDVRAVYGVVRRFIQDRFSLKEKARRKRRAFVQALHAA